MPAPQILRQRLESWKQIAAHLNRSERTVRRWEEAEGLPVHRHEHAKQDTVFAYLHELEAWTRQRTQLPTRETPRPAAVLPAGEATKADIYLQEHDAITRVLHLYIAGARAGQSEIMRPAFHPHATISGFCWGDLYTGSIQHVFDWIDANGPAPSIQARFARIEVIETIAVVHLDVQGWTGRQVGAETRASDVFTLLKCAGQWSITHKLFHWHS
jgi:hypothetical protein